jgi:transcriptional regulator with XRE-family HTH domain
MNVKRCKKIIETKESKALLAMRNYRGVSIRDLSRRLKKSHTAVHQYETGRAEINGEYINLFLKELNYSKEDWNLFLKENDEVEELRIKCLELVHGIEASRLDGIYRVLVGEMD